MATDLVSQIGLGAEFPFEGKTWVVGPISNHLRGLYQRWLVGEAFQFVDSLRGSFSRVRIETMENQIVRDAAAHQYDWDSQACNDSLLTIAGIKAMFLIRLQVNHPQANAQLVEKIFEAWGWEKPLNLMALADGKDKKKETMEKAETPSASENSVENSSKNSPT